MKKYKTQDEAFNDLSKCPPRIYLPDGRVICISSWEPVGSVDNVEDTITVTITGYISKDV